MSVINPMSCRTAPFAGSGCLATWIPPSASAPNGHAPGFQLTLAEDDDCNDILSQTLKIGTAFFPSFRSPLSPTAKSHLTLFNGLCRKTLKTPTTNIVLTLIDDIGFFVTATFGGLVATPTFERLVLQDLHYSQFHDPR